MDDRWIINRAGLLNFWYYDDEVFEFSGGRLLLRGSNGSGKSVTMQSFIPLLLDGNKSPERLDPFGSRARRLEDYLLGEEDVNGIDERTGYLYMEFKKGSKDNYISIGIGLKAKRHQSMDFWGFIIKDGRRIGIDILLYKMETGIDGKRVKIPLSKKELKNCIGSGGEVVDSQREYMELVNKNIFGFSSIDDYDELIKLLIQLRSPKLSKDFRPTVIYDILRASLSPLTDDDLRPMSETIENMDQIKLHLDSLNKNMKSLKKLKNEYDRYNKFMLYYKAEKLLMQKNELTKVRKQSEEIRQSIEKNNQDVLKGEDKISELASELQALKNKEIQLRKNNAFNTQRELVEEENILKQYRKDKNLKELQLKKKKDRYFEIEEELKNLEGREYSIDKNIKDNLECMASISEEVNFDEHSFSEEELKKSYGKDFDFDFWNNSLKEYTGKVRKALDALNDEAEANQKYNDALLEEDRLRKANEDLKRKVNEIEILFDEEKSRFIDKIYDWSDTNKLLKLNREDIEKLARIVLSYGETSVYEDLISSIRKPYDDIRGRLQMDMLKVKNELDLKNSQLDEKEEELRKWKETEDPEPERSEQVLENRKRLDKAGIAYVPLYKAIDFKNDIDDDTKGNIESALIDMGILDALIVSRSDLDRAIKMDKDMADKYIVPGTFNMKLNVLQYFNVVDSNNGVSPEEISDALSNVFIYEEENATYINDDGTYGIGILKGKAAGNVKSRYIGFESRRRFRDEMISSIAKEISIIKDEIRELNDRQLSIKSQLSDLDVEYKNFPEKDDLEEALKELKEAQSNQKFTEDKLNDATLAAKKFFDVLQEKRAVVRKLTSEIGIHADVKAYKDALGELDEYKNLLQKLQINYNSYITVLRNIDTRKMQKQDIEYDIDNYKFEIDVLDTKIKNSIEKINVLKETIEKLGIEDLQKELSQCIKRIDDIPKEINDLTAKTAALKERIVLQEKEYERLREEIRKNEDILNIYDKGLKDEITLGFIDEFTNLDDMYKLAKTVQSQYKEMFTKFDKDSATEKLRNAFYVCINELVEFGLSLDVVENEQSDVGMGTYQEIYKDLRRYQITAKVNDKKISLYGLYNMIDEDIKINENLMKEKDRQLFEDIIMHNVGRKIRSRIFKAEEWVKKMNDLMSQRDTSSGLKFQLEWKPKAATNEQELNTRELVELLKLDADMMKEEDFNLVVNHFRSKVESAKKIYEENSNTDTFHQIMKSILDYRDWFEFKLYFKKEGENRKELTNNAFYKFSGGEKAMAMYIPLFSAVYSMYQSASSHAPKIISLDEAFAGVDDNNIRDMFKLIEDLGLNFIMNSQVLWGDYDTVPELSIYELIRPKNASYVSLIKYKWDGKIRHLVTGIEESVEATDDFSYDEVAYTRVGE
ncbi:chromosome segregation atpase [Thermoanaerobacterium thermosaccharolyticum]|uniref:Chromosome segregation atpase n=1 Tax=Thermoanaerobacterium thermosaccharolyticum TaxID=1517 RepID=A0A223I1L3_THETR|nr:TIGR02680 family protein [Thermoanaerobacterium thermosaccharolyticum]AST58621.1 chromosome segregation atpase [Thermoanaerobacterium thermosaccharolyticum]